MIQPNNEFAIQTRSIHKVFKDFWLRPRVRAVTDLNLDIERGQVYGLLGPNGSGKSTTIKMLLGLLKPTNGMISVLGYPPNNVKVKDKIGYLPEESYLYRFLNSRETLDYYGRLFHIPRTERKARTEQLLEMVGLSAAANRPLSEYSKGMQRRLGLAQALINDPELLILDEPTTGMDPLGTRQIKDLILALKGKTTVLLSSHLLDVVEDVSDRVAILYGGRLQREGTVSELLEAGETTYVEVQNPSQTALDVFESTLEKEGKAIVSVTRPRVKLERLFLDILADARGRGVATSGAQEGGEVAGFLAGPEDEKAKAREALKDLVEVKNDESSVEKQESNSSEVVEEDTTKKPDTKMINAMLETSESTDKLETVAESSEVPTEEIKQEAGGLSDVIETNKAEAVSEPVSHEKLEKVTEERTNEFDVEKPNEKLWTPPTAEKQQKSKTPDVDRGVIDDLL